MTPLLSHLRVLGIPVGLLINFDVVLLKDGIKRVVNNFKEQEEASSGFDRKVRKGLAKGAKCP